MSELNIKQTDLFATPVWKLETGIDCKPIKLLVQKIKNQDRVGNKLSNVGGWQSAQYPCKNIPAELDSLFSILDSAVRLCLDSISIPNLVEINNFWFNINKSGNYNKLHNHRKSLVSGVFYIQTPKDCGDISFERHDDSQYYLPEDLENRNFLTGSAVNFKAESGVLLLFPSWLLHQVEPSQSQTPRISMSFNYSMKDIQNG